MKMKMKMRIGGENEYERVESGNIEWWTDKWATDTDSREKAQSMLLESTRQKENQRRRSETAQPNYDFHEAEHPNESRIWTS